MLKVEYIGLNEFEKSIRDLEKHFPREQKRLLRQVGSKARTIVARKARQLVRKRSGRFRKSIKRGKVFQDNRNGQWTVRVYSKDPKVHLIEKGHRIVDRNGVEHGFQPGKHVFAKADAEVDRQMTEIIETEFSKIIKKL